MTDQSIHPHTGKVPGRGDYKGLYRAVPPALTDQPGDVLPPTSVGLSDLLSGPDGTDHGRRRVYNLSDEHVEPEQGSDHDTDAETDDAGADVLTADSDDAEGLEW